MNVFVDFWNAVLKGESKTYNDHNWYDGSGLRGYIEGRGSKAYPLLKKPLSEYTIGEVKAFQNRPRDSKGQLWATGRYQIIPNTLTGAVERAGLSDSDLYDKKNQDKLGIALLKKRKTLWAYLNGEIPDTIENLQKATLDMAMEWSSIGVPYTVRGSKRTVNKDESYYSGGGDRASTKSDVIMEKLKNLRKNWSTELREFLTATTGKIKERPLLTIGMATAFSLACYVIYKQLIKK